MTENPFVKNSYTACINGECPQSAECLHYLYYQELGDKPLHINVLNPNVARSQQGNCPHFKTSAPQPVAYGFIHIIESLPLSASRSFMDEMISIFGRKNYYQLRKGERYMLKEDQDLVLAAARTHGATHLEFDKYDEVVVY